jgi:hypothetical protein
LIVRSAVLLTLSVVAGVPTDAGAQQIRGKVIDNFGQGIGGVRVSIVGSAYQASTNSSGAYEIRYAPGTFTVSFQRVGYTPGTLPLSLASPTAFPAQTITLHLIPPLNGVSFAADSRYVLLPRCAVTRQTKEHPFSWDKVTLSAFWYANGAPIELPSGKDAYRFAVSVTEVRMGLYRILPGQPFYTSETIGNPALGKRNLLGDVLPRGREFVSPLFAIDALAGVQLTPGVYAFVEAGGQHIMSDFGNITDDPRVKAIPAENTQHCYIFRVGSSGTASTPATGTVAGIPTPSTSSAPSRTSVSVRFVNETNGTVMVFMDGSQTTFWEIPAKASLSRTLSPGSHEIRVQAASMVGSLVLRGRAFRRTIRLDADSEVRIAEGDFR